MKPKSLLFFYVLVLIIISSCKPQVDLNTNDIVDIVYDSIKAQEYGADAYGMKKYVMAFLKRGPNQSLDTESSQVLQMAHLENIGRMAEEGKLVLAGPFFGDQDLRGIYIFNVETIEEAEALSNSDPAMQAGVFELELMEWYGSAALMAVNDIHNQLSKKEVTEN